jgi:hypothetical protein
MSWHQVLIGNSDVVNLSATALIDQFVTAYRTAGAPEGVSVYHARNTQGDHIYYFSPQASSIATNLFSQFHATACAVEPDVSLSRKIVL